MTALTLDIVALTSFVLLALPMDRSLCIPGDRQRLRRTVHWRRPAAMRMLNGSRRCLVVITLGDVRVMVIPLLAYLDDHAITRG